MSERLTIILILLSFFLFIITSHFLKKGRIPEKYAIIWYGFSLLILILGVFPGLFSVISLKLGFQLMSNMIIFILIGFLFILVMILTIMIAGQKKKTTLLIQEVSILKNEVNKYEGKK